MSVTRDPDTGQVQSVNGPPGKALAWLRLLAPIMNAVIVAVVLAAFPWIIRVEKFMDAGPRVTPVELERLRGDLRLEWMETLEREVPPEVVTTRLGALEASLSELKVDVKSNSLALASVQTEISAIRRILERR